MAAVIQQRPTTGTRPGLGHSSGAFTGRSASAAARVVPVASRPSAPSQDPRTLALKKPQKPNGRRLACETPLMAHLACTCAAWPTAPCCRAPVCRAQPLALPHCRCTRQGPRQRLKRRLLRGLHRYRLSRLRWRRRPSPRTRLGRLRSGADRTVHPRSTRQPSRRPCLASAQRHPVDPDTGSTLQLELQTGATAANRIVENAMAARTAKPIVIVTVTQERKTTTKTVTPGQHATTTTKRAMTAATAAAAAQPTITVRRSTTTTANPTLTL